MSTDLEKRSKKGLQRLLMKSRIVVGLNTWNASNSRSSLRKCWIIGEISFNSKNHWANKRRSISRMQEWRDLSNDNNVLVSELGYQMFSESRFLRAKRFREMMTLWWSQLKRWKNHTISMKVWNASYKPRSRTWKRESRRTTCRICRWLEMTPKASRMMTWGRKWLMSVFTSRSKPWSTRRAGGSRRVANRTWIGR